MFPEIQRYFRVAKTALNLCTSKFLLRRFWSKTKTTFEGESLCKASISVTPSDYGIRKISDSRIFFWVSSEHIMWLSSDLSLIRVEWFSSRDLYQTPLFRELFKQVEFSSRFFSGAKQSFSEGRARIYISMATDLRQMTAALMTTLVYLKKTSVSND